MSDITPRSSELSQRVDEVLHYVWDPLGVSETPEARDEYHSYVPQVVSLLVRHATADQLVELLAEIHGRRMDVCSLDRARERARGVVPLLEKWRDVLEESERAT